MGNDPPSFGTLLKQHRVSRSLTQERLAERAGVSATAIAALEAGRRKTPRLSTIALLVDALGLDDDERVALVAAATADDHTRSPLADPIAEHAAPPDTRPAGPIEFPGVMRQFAFVGRPDERRRLDDAWDRGTRVVLVSGEAGAGKTRLVGEFATNVADTASVFWGRCTPDRLGAYEPFVEPVRAAVRAAGAETAPGPMMDELVRILPELGRGPADPTGPSIADPGVERRLLFDAVGELFARSGRALFVVDDLQWADAGTLALLTHLASTPALDELTIVGMIRSTDLDVATAATLSELRRRATLERFTLGGLTGDDLRTLVRAVAGTDVGDAFVDAIAAATDGNPLFAAELTEHLLEHEWQPHPDGDDVDPRTIPVPIGVRETLTQRLETLSPAAQELVRAGAVLGRTFDTDVAALLADLDGGRVLVATEDAILSGLVLEVSARSLTFSHALVQSAVYESMSARRRIDTHRRAAVALAAASEFPTTGDATVYDIARHWEIVAAHDPTATAEAVQWTARAGDSAAAAADIGEAIRRYEWAARHSTAPTAPRAELLLKLGAAYSARGDIASADEQFWTALALADDISDARLYADAAIGLAATVRFGRHDPVRIAALERAIRDLPDAEDVRRTTAAAMLKRQLGFDLSEPAYQRRQVVARIVLDAVSADVLPRELLIALGAARDSIVVDDPNVLERVSRQMIEAARRPRNLPMLANAWYGKAWAALELADAPGWREATVEFARIADELELPYELALAARMAAATALMEGRYADAEELGQRSLELAADADPNAGAIQLTNAVMRGIDRGEARETLAVMLVARAELDSVPTFVAGLAMTAAFAGDVEVAREILDRHAASGFQDVRRDLEWLPVIGLLCHACITLGDERYAHALGEQLASHPARSVRIGPLGAWWGPTDYYLGALAGVLGHADEAEFRLRAAVATCAALGARPWIARTRIALADLLAEHRPDLDDEVTALRESARSIATELDAPGIVALLP